MGLLQGKVVLVTGGARRVGAAIARRAHREGATLMIHHRASVNDARKLQSELNAIRADSVSLLQGDLLDTGKLPHLIAHTVQTWGRLDALVNNASTFSPTPVGDITEDAWHDLVGTNMKAPLFLVAGRGAAPEENAGRDRQHHRHPRRAAAQELRRLLDGEGGARCLDAIARARARARGARQRRRARTDPVARRQRVRRAGARSGSSRTRRSSASDRPTTSRAPSAGC